MTEEKNISLEKMNSFGVIHRAKKLISFENKDEVIRYLKNNKSERTYPYAPVYPTLKNNYEDDFEDDVDFFNQIMAQLETYSFFDATKVYGVCLLYKSQSPRD